jgi:hypothetical protein
MLTRRRTFHEMRHARGSSGTHRWCEQIINTKTEGRKIDMAQIVCHKSYVKQIWQNETIIVEMLWRVLQCVVPITKCASRKAIISDHITNANCCCILCDVTSLATILLDANVELNHWPFTQKITNAHCKQLSTWWCILDGATIAGRIFLPVRLRSVTICEVTVGYNQSVMIPYGTWNRKSVEM